MENPVVHFEINGPDPEGLAKFYSDLLGWNVQAFPMPDGNVYRMVDTQGGEGINGGIDSSEGGNAAGIVVYVATPQIQATLDKAVSLGAKVAVPVTVVPDIVTFAQFVDPQGVRVALVQDDGTQEPQGVTKGDGAAVGWFEILGTDGVALHEFYSTLFDWKIENIGPEFGNYGLVEPGDKGIHGGVGASQGEPMSTIYANVDDLQKTLEKAESLGATRVMEPMEVPGGTTIASFRDPWNNVFGIMKNG
jgi:predicted enzyme related to lactoylglutathione lyase